MFVAVIITLVGLAYTVLYVATAYGEVKWTSRNTLAIAAFDAAVVTILARRDPCYSFTSVGTIALYVNVFFVLARITELKNRELAVWCTTWLGLTALAATYINCDNDE